MNKQLDKNRPTEKNFRKTNFSISYQIKYKVQCQSVMNIHRTSQLMCRQLELGGFGPYLAVQRKKIIHSTSTGKLPDSKDFVIHASDRCQLAHLRDPMVENCAKHPWEVELDFDLKESMLDFQSNYQGLGLLLSHLLSCSSSLKCPMRSSQLSPGNSHFTIVSCVG